MNGIPYERTPGRPCTGRGDLLRLLIAHGEEGLHAMAGLAGFEAREEKTKPTLPPEETGKDDGETAPPTTHLFVDLPSAKAFWMVSVRREKKADEKEDGVPEWALLTPDNPCFKDGEVREDRGARRPRHIPLVPWSRIWPLLRCALGVDRQGRDIHMGRLIDTVTRLRPLKRLPFTSRFSWNPTATLIFDRDERLLPLWKDMDMLQEGVEDLRGKSGLQVYMMTKGPDGPVKRRKGRYGTDIPFQFPEPGTPVLIVSDLGCLDPSDDAKAAWRHWGEQFNRAGITPVVLTPCPPDLWNTGHTRCFRPVWWDWGNRLLGRRIRKPHAETEGKKKVRAARARADRLLMLLSPAIRVEPRLLRAVRMALPCKEGDASSEILAWNHPLMRPTAVAFTYIDAAADLREKFKQENDRVLKETVFSLIRHHHAHLSQAVRCVEELIMCALAQRDPARADRFMKTFFRTLGNSNQFKAQDNLRYWFREMTERLHKEVWAGSEILSACWLKIHMEEWLAGRVDPPDGADISTSLWLVPAKDAVERFQVRQRGERLVISGENASKETDTASIAAGSPVTAFSTRQSRLTLTVSGENQTISLSPGRDHVISLPPSGPLVLSTEMVEITLDTRTKPGGCSAMGRDETGLYVKMGDKETSVRHAPSPWSAPMDVDEFGFYADLEVKGVVMRMRYIDPGEFMMGSPEDERERRDDERHHRVRLTQGFWLADTACTQDLWQAVMGANPSSFKGPDRPVENVSWEDAIAFIDTLNRLGPDFDFRLPTEAQWEYACRAGTTTPFSFGENITPDQVNYYGSRPYAGGKKRKYIGKTVDVKSLRPNPWGLYEMHGNVMEWCGDWYGDYPGGDAVDPKGPGYGGDRVLRGGSWLSSGRLVRSAFRDGFTPDSRRYYTGFRVSRGQSSGERREKEAGPATRSGSGGRLARRRQRK